MDPRHQPPDKGKGVIGVEEAQPVETPRVSPKYMIHPAIPVKQSSLMNPAHGDPWSSHSHRLPPSQGEGNRFPLPKGPKVEILVFKGDCNVLNWLYQMDHSFSLHDTPIEEN